MVKHTQVKFFTPNVPVLDKDNVGIILLLKVNAQTKDRFLCVANTHLLFNKNRGDIKLAQLAYLFAEIHKVSLTVDGHVETHCPVILCGDFNSIPYSPLYRFLVSGQLNYTLLSPAMISGQLTQSQAKRSSYSKNICYPLLPWEFGISGNCQWRNALKDGENGSETKWNNLKCQPTKNDVKTTARLVDKVVVSEEVNQSAPKCSKSANKQEKCSKNGLLSIPWYLKSVYTHYSRDGTPEVTTCHSKGSSNVDYIFFSTGIRKSHDVDQKPCIQEGKLILLGRLKLMNKTDFEKMDLPPNQTHPSDHLSLKAQFKLT